MQALHVAAEMYPLVKTGGLGDVTAALPPALAEQGIDVRILLPGFPAILDGVSNQEWVATLDLPFGVASAAIRRGKVAGSGVTVYALDAPDLFQRSGNPYLGPDGKDWSDNYLRFAVLGFVAAHLSGGDIDPNWRADIVHCHDWHAGLAPAYLAAEVPRKSKTVFTIHNLAFQGIFPLAAFPAVGLPADFWSIAGAEFYKQISFMKAGLVYADRLTTVSPTYAREIQGAEQGCGLDGILTERSGALTGILNGVDYKIWNSATDSALAKGYDATNLSGKAACKTALQQAMGLTQRPGSLLFGVVSRLTDQKGLDLVLEALPEIMRQGGQLVLLGSGDPALEQGFRDFAAAQPDDVAVSIGYDEGLSHRIIAGADVIMIPSRFEPCGLTQLYGLRYGALPLVRRVGGLADTVVDATPEHVSDGSATGFAFDAATTTDLIAAVNRALLAYRHTSLWSQMMRRAMAQDFSWSKAAARYIELYRELQAGP